MERYSDRAIEIINELHRERLDYQSEYLPLIDAANKLSAYEDTGLEPEQVMSATIDPESLRPVSSWEWNDIDSHWECKRCMSVNLNIPRVKSVNPHVFDGSRYCPHCGAKMEG